CFRLTELAFDVEVKKLQDAGAQSGIDIGRRLGLKRIVRLREGSSGKQGEQSEAAHDYLNYRRVAAHAQGGLAARAPSPAAGPLAGLPAGGLGRPPRSRGTAPPSRCQSDYLSQADTPLAEIGGDHGIPVAPRLASAVSSLLLSRCQGHRESALEYRRSPGIPTAFRSFRPAVLLRTSHHRRQHAQV